MSSHHFVKEKQEPALYIHSENFLDVDLLGELLEWSPFVIADEHALYVLNHAPIKIDLVVQQDLSIEEISEWTANQSNLKILNIDVGKNKLRAVLNYLKKENHFALSLIACAEKDFSELLNFDFDIDIIQYTKEYKAFFMQDKFSKWKEKNSIFEIQSDNIKTQNLEKHKVHWRVVKDGLVEIEMIDKTLVKEYFLGN